MISMKLDAKAFCNLTSWNYNNELQTIKRTVAAAASNTPPEYPLYLLIN